MFKEILMALGVLFVIFMVIGFAGIVLRSLGEERLRVSYPGYEAPPFPPSFQEKIVKEGEMVREEVLSEISRLVIKIGSLNLVVKDINETVDKIIQYTEEKNGWVVSSSVTEVEEIPSGVITVRVPSENFAQAIDFFKSLAEKVSYEGTQAEDVTEEYIDLQSRLKNLEATEAQLLKIMERSGTIPEVLAVQKELTNVREQIESTKGRIQYLERSVQMASITINLALSEELLPIPPAEKWRPVYIIKRAWQSVLRTLRAISYLLIWISIYALIWVPLGVIIWQGKKFWEKRKKTKKI